jgi:hypothetical protein
MVIQAVSKLFSVEFEVLPGHGQINMNGGRTTNIVQTFCPVRILSEREQNRQDPQDQFHHEPQEKAN